MNLLSFILLNKSGTWIQENLKLLFWVNLMTLLSNNGISWPLIDAAYVIFISFKSYILLTCGVSKLMILKTNLVDLILHLVPLLCEVKQFLKIHSFRFWDERITSIFRKGLTIRFMDNFIIIFNLWEMTLGPKHFLRCKTLVSALPFAQLFKSICLLKL